MIKILSVDLREIVVFNLQGIWYHSLKNLFNELII